MLIWAITHSADAPIATEEEAEQQQLEITQIKGSVIDVSALLCIQRIHFYRIDKVNRAKTQRMKQNWNDVEQTFDWSCTLSFVKVESTNELETSFCSINNSKYKNNSTERNGSYSQETNSKIGPLFAKMLLIFTQLLFSPKCHSIHFKFGKKYNKMIKQNRNFRIVLNHVYSPSHNHCV